MQIGDRACNAGELLGHLRDQLGLPPLVFLQADHTGGELVRGRRRQRQLCRRRRLLGALHQLARHVENRRHQLDDL